MKLSSSSRKPVFHSRRQALSALGGVLATVPLLPAFGCGSDTDTNTDFDDAASSETGSGSGTPRESETSLWASGGTAALTGTTPNPFEGSQEKLEENATCLLTCSSTLGPCYAETIERSDISEGQLGLPMRLALSVVDSDCQPIEGATVDIWHTSATGFYSGRDTAALCTLGNPQAESSLWFRGIQTTDATGGVEFQSCFPGWYGGRTLHIHFTVRIGDTETLTSQLYFDDQLGDEIVASEPVYSARGSRDTTNANDGVLAGGAPANLMLNTERLPDGSLLAWKRLFIRSATSAPLSCDESA